MSDIKAIVQIRNTGTEPIPVGGKYLFGGESRSVPRYLAEAARSAHTALVILGENVQAAVETVEGGQVAVDRPGDPAGVETTEPEEGQPQLLLADEPKPEIRKRGRREAVNAG